MVSGQDEKSKDFFKDNWHHPLRRLGKILVPIICACTVSLSVIFALYYTVPHILSFVYQPRMDSSFLIFKHALISVITGVFLVFGWGAVYRYFQSQFRPIQLKISKRVRSPRKKGC